MQQIMAVKHVPGERQPATAPALRAPPGVEDSHSVRRQSDRVHRPVWRRRWHAAAQTGVTQCVLRRRGKGQPCRTGQLAESQFPEGSQGDAQCPGDMNIRRQIAVQGGHIRRRGGQAYLLDGQRPQRDVTAAAKLAGGIFAFRDGETNAVSRGTVTPFAVSPSCVSGYSFTTAIDGVG